MNNNVKKFIKDKMNHPIVFSTPEICVEKRAPNDDSEKKSRYIKLQVQLDSWSPVYEMFGIKYREKIASDAFDKNKKIEEQELHSYVDHDISIEKMIGSTTNKTMKVTRKDNTICAEVKIDENDPIAKKTADLIQSGAIKSNSFIFKAKAIKETWYEDDDANKECDLEIEYTDGDLISIDPVYKGFFPQCETSIEQKKLDLILEKIEKNSERVNMEEEKVIKDVVESKENTQSLQETKIVSGEKLTIEPVNNEIDIESIVNKRLETNLGLLKKALNKNVENKPINYNEVRSKWLNRKHLSKEENEVLYKDFVELKKDAEVRNDTMFLKSIDYVNTDSKKTIQTESLISRALDGKTEENGLALIENLTSKNIIAEWRTVFPELTEFATILPIIGLNKVQQPVLIPDKSKVNKLNEGDKSQKQGALTTKVVFTPDRYSVELDQNNQLNAFDNTLEKQTLTIQDNIREGLRSEFYKNLFASLKANLDADNYVGGATQESIRQTATVNTFKMSDLDAVVNELYAKWGDRATEGYVISMHVDILQHLENEYFSSGNSLWKDIYNPVNRTFRGIKIIPLNIDGIDKTVETGKYVAALFLKSAVVAYGCSFVIQDSAYEMMSEDFHSRFIRLRGQIKMCDPHLNTRVIKVQ